MSSTLQQDINSKKEDSHFLVREAQIEDYDQLCNLYHQSDLYHYQSDKDYYCVPPNPARSRQYIKKILRNLNSTILVIEVEGKIAGMSEITFIDHRIVHFTKQRRTAHVGVIVVDKDQRGTGLANLLADKMIEWSRNGGASEITCEVFEFNKISLAMNEKIGLKTRFRTLYLPLFDPPQPFPFPNPPPSLAQRIRLKVAWWVSDMLDRVRGIK
ncbi:GNAT family N-acetyltransferase [Pseudobacteriovorax antillogorgiicola]|uniref:Ribosomal protein S18 acetylase RimI n=1 Tax=Pseudobacteriovorax antillogorgiicola TaxID=1513793 RepID=A0A1Y6CF29_9BACT|nr:GNAT family N-acetyltransferase [Pseudobacteriovorax antillogorgiicola]TCS47938.1 ribosomal protein S18 acetylase RimI-like enzyme [Pseudobacteriovorax antillogorgiicola]SMF58048.1 Ribosomal protein S18 acetylase RimI [Pseudobacteriovorax antillogorgiicola]